MLKENNMVQSVFELITDGSLDFLDFASYEGDLNVHLGAQTAASTDAAEQDAIDALFDSSSAIKYENVITGSGNDTVKGSNNDNLIGLGAGNDIAFGLGGNDKIDGGAGNDRLSGGDGNDRLRGENGDDVIRGGNGKDTIDGGSGDDYILGEDGNDTIFGGNGSDYMSGGDGDDALNGAQGSDGLRGGLGKDTFIFNAAASSNVASGEDIILDFEHCVDTIDLSKFDAISGFEDLTITSLRSDGSKVNVSHADSGFTLDVVFNGEFCLTASDFEFAVSSASEEAYCGCTEGALVLS